MSPQLASHARREGRNHVARDEECGHVEQINEDLVPERTTL